jgi:hypothetical protein
VKVAQPQSRPFEKSVSLTSGIGPRLSVQHHGQFKVVAGADRTFIGTADQFGEGVGLVLPEENGYSDAEVSKEAPPKTLCLLVFQCAAAVRAKLRLQPW